MIQRARGHDREQASAPPVAAAGRRRRRCPARRAVDAADAARRSASGAARRMMLQTVRTQDYFWALGVGRDAPTAEIDRAYEALARSFHADRYRLSPEDDRRLAQEIFDSLAEAHRVAARSRHAQGVPRASWTRETSEDGRAAARRADAGDAAASDRAAAAVTANAAARALYDVGLEHLQARRHHEAVEALRQAARLVPNEADFRAALGWALFRQAPADARAGRAAIAELRRALQIDERHRGAAQHLAEIYAADRSARPGDPGAGTAAGD